jgi:hypothetical protein
MAALAATMSCTLPLNPLEEKSPSLSPKPVKSKRSTAMPVEAKARETLTAAIDRFVQVKQ